MCDKAFLMTLEYAEKVRCDVMQRFEHDYLRVYKCTRCPGYHLTTKRFKQMSDKKFFVVWRPEGGIPAVKHGDFDQARDEARRIAEKHKGDDVFVLLAATKYKYEPVKETSLK